MYESGVPASQDPEITDAAEYGATFAQEVFESADDETLREVSITAAHFAATSLQPALEAAKQRALEAEQELTIDSLTGLKNRYGFEQSLQEVITVTRETDAPVSLAVFYFDNLKAINDVEGHAAGDNALVQAASILQQAEVNTNKLDSQNSADRIKVGTTGRLEEGDEFAVPLLQADYQRATDWCQWLQTQFLSQGLQMRVGLVTEAGDYASAAELIEEARRLHRNSG